MEEEKRKNGKKLFLEFQQELEKWYFTGIRPSLVDENAAWLMELQSRRLKENGLKMDVDMKSGREVFLESVTASAETHREESTYSKAVKKKTVILNNDKKIYSQKEEVIMTQDIVSMENDTTGVHGKVHDFGWRKEGDEASRLIEKYKKAVIAVVAGLELLSALLISVTVGEFSVYIILGALVFAAFPIIPLVLIGHFIMHFVALGIRKKKSGSYKAANILTRKEADKRLSECDFELTFPYIEKKAVDIAKVFLLGGTYGNSAIGQTGQQGEEFRNILDVRYTGETEVCCVRKHDGFICISLNITFNDLKYTGKKVKEIREKIHMEMHRGENDDEDSWIVTSIAPCI